MKNPDFPNKIIIMKDFMQLMKSTLLIFSLFSTFIFTAQAAEAQEKLAGFDKTTLYTLLNILKVDHSGDLSSIVKATQKAWIRKGERWETADLYEEKKQELLPYLEKLELINAWLPQKTTYTGILFLGSANFSVENKADFLINQLQQGLEPNSLILLTGQRYLTDEERVTLIGQGANKDTMITETDMVRFTINKKLSAAGFADIPITVIDTPGKTTHEGKYLRPTTLDTVVEWLKTNPTPGNYLSISFQPHCRYQLTILESMLPKNISVEVVGDKYDTRVAVLLDAITRTLYAYQEGLK